uniref:Uncharacterized protein n=1 Tax=Meloidogyne floridensis TaxID=298350 RepID=A0A915NML6_9BILA
MEFKFYIFLLFCASIKSEVHQTENDVIEEVNEFLTAFSKLASPMADWLEHLEVAKQTTLDLMKMSGPVSALVAASLNKAFAKESKEYQAMVNLNRGMKNSFNNLDVNLQNIQRKELDMFDISTYLNQVTMRIASLSLSVDYATNPVFSRSVPIKQAFINACVGENGPEQILMKISRLTRRSCKSTSEEMEKLHSEALN